jgi:predicted DCC family thiol-disulfide oxidoreductase YuxK
VGDAAALLLFDGECGLCDRAVRFLAAIDRRRRLRFAPLQGETAAPWRELARERPGGPLEWLVLVEEPERGPAARVRVRAAAVARALAMAGGRWRLAGRALAAVPRPLADAAYLAVARRRHRLAGSCALPAPGDDRFLR